MPLLPFERALIAELGWDEDSYRFFAAEARRRAAERPAEYAGIPDIRCEPFSLTTFLVNLAVGIALTAVSVLLAPKPAEPPNIGQRKLNDKNGPSRFNSTYGFDSVAEMAAWGDPLPISFGKYTGFSGGLVITPKLVWSRMFSYGSHQSVKALYTCGEWGLAKPNLKGIFLGTAPLDAAYNHIFAVYYRRDPGNNRIAANDLLYGSRGTTDSGDPETYAADIYSCPSRDAENDEAFCHAYVPSGNTAFGIYNPIANGTGLRAMWRVISRIKSEGDAGERTEAERQKICGRGGRATGMPGVGREYVRGMGIIAINGQTYDAVTDVQIYKGTRITFRIASGSIPGDFYDKGRTGVTVDDLNSTSKDERAAADSLLQLGETIQIGRSSWRVIHRTLDLWRGKKGAPHQDIILECVEYFGHPWITAIPADLIQKFTNINSGEGFNTSNHVGLSSYPLARQAMATVRNLRECDVVEIGIKSQVWNQANGMMNWKEVPTPEKLIKWDNDNVQVSGGTMNKYLLRTSAFTIKVRPAKLNPDGSGAYDWKPLAEQFCIRGQRPVDVFNFLRIYFPQREQFEFRFEPMPGSVIVRAFQPDELFWSLDARGSGWLTKTYDTPYGTFKVTGAGEWIAQAELITNIETGAPDRDVDYIDTGVGPTEVVVDHYDAAPYNAPHGKAHGWRGELLGWPQLHPGETRSADIVCSVDGATSPQTATLRITCTSLYVPSTLNTPQWYTPALYSDYIWGPPQIQVISATGASDNWSVGQTLSYTQNITRDADGKNNKWLHEAYTYGARTVTAVFSVQNIGQVTAVVPEQEAARMFIPSSQCADVSFYPNEWRTSNADRPEHEITYVSEIRANEPLIPSYYNMTMFGLVLKSNKNFASLEQPRLWIPGGIQVKRWYPDAAHFNDRGIEIGRSNLFSDFVYWLLTDKGAGAGDVIHPEQMDEDSFQRSAKFLSVNRIFCDTAMEDQANIRQYISDNAPLHLLSFTIINGRFGVAPALPVTEAGTFDTGAVPISAIFTEGNIIEDSFTVDYLDLQDRAKFKAVVSYRQGDEYQLPQEFTATVRYQGATTSQDPFESFNLAAFCTQRLQAILTAKYMLALRNRVRHTIKFQTTPHGLSLGPGAYIRVVTQANPYSPVNNGVVRDDGVVVAVNSLADGNYPITYYRRGAEDVMDGTLTVTNGTATDPALRDAIFTIKATDRKSGVYQVQQITLTEEGLVEILASEFPCDDQLRSLILQDMLNDQVWEVTE